jgi:hypothetical protein
MDPDMDLKQRQKNNNTMDSPNNYENNSHHRNIISQITSLYEREFPDEIRVPENLRVKIKRRVAYLEFYLLILVSYFLFVFVS